MSNVFVTSASGNIGVELVPLLVKSSSIKRIVLPTSNASKLSASTPKSDKVIVIEGSIQDPQWLEKQFQDHEIDTVSLNLTGADELFTTMNFLSSIQRSGCIKHLVYLSACGDFLSPDFRQVVLRDCLAAHVTVKVLVEQILQATRPRGEANGLSWTILGPTLFMENDNRAKAAMMNKGFYPEPIGSRGISRVSTKDIALAFVKAIEDNGKAWDRKKIMIGSKTLYTEKDISKLWGDALGKPINVQSADADGLDEVENHFKASIGPAWGRDLRLMYESFGQRIFHGDGFGMTDEEYETQKKFFGKEPNAYEDFVKNAA